MLKDNMNISAALERSGLSVKLAAAACFITFAQTLLVFLVGFVYEWSGLMTFSLSLVAFGISFIFAVTAVVQCLLQKKSFQEEEEKILLEKRKEGKTSILDVSEDIRFTAGRTLANFQKYIPSAISVICLILMSLLLFYFWKYVMPSAPKLPKNPIVLAVLCAMSFTFSLFPGIFLVGQSHLREFRYLRPVGTWLLAGSGVMLLAVVSAILVHSGVKEWSFDAGAGRVVFFIFAVLAAELLSSFATEFYRPRTQLEDRPVYESRLLSLFTEPGGLMRNIADALDYQFGFKVSKTWIYTFLEKSLVPALLLWLAALWIFTSVDQVSPGELGIRERFGALVGEKNKTVLKPGIHFKLPWPFEKIHRVQVDAIQRVMIGASYSEEGKTVKPGVVLWTNEHYAAEHGFLVANDAAGVEQSKAVSVLVAAIPVNYKVRRDSVYAYTYNFADMENIVMCIGRQEATSYFASTDFMKDMSSGRDEVAGQLRAKIQKAADTHGLGIDIVSVNLLDTHPPVKEVAPAFQAVLAANEEARGFIYEANAEAGKIRSEGDIKSMQIRSSAEAYRFDVSSVAAATAFRFRRQLEAYRINPFIFRLRAYLDFLENDCASLRKYIISADIPSQIYELNMEENPRLDLLSGADLTGLGK